MRLKRGRTAVIVILAAAATVGAADLLRAPGESGDSLEKARAEDLLDPDAPIATARYREPSPQALAQAGLAPAPVQLAAAEPPVIAIDDPVPPPVDPVIRQMAALAAPVRMKVQAAIAAQTGAIQPPDPQALAALSFADDQRAGARAGSGSIGDNARALLVRIAPTREDARRGRWFLFAAASGKAFGLNMVRDSEAGLRKAGWSVERLATWGKGQLGVGWRRRNLQASLSVAQREIGDLGINIEDTIAGFTLSWRPHDQEPAPEPARAQKANPPQEI